MFYGKIRQCILADTVNQPSIDHNKHNKEDLFSHLPVSVSDDGTDLYDGLSRYMDNVVDYQGRKARMKISVVELPSILHIQLQVGYHCLPATAKLTNPLPESAIRSRDQTVVQISGLREILGDHLHGPIPGDL